MEAGGELWGCGGGKPWPMGCFAFIMGGGGWAETMLLLLEGIAPYGVAAPPFGCG